MIQKTMAMALAGLMLTSMAGTTALTAKAENDDVMELTCTSRYPSEADPGCTD